MLGAIAGAETTMMLASESLRVVLATTHIPLRAVPERFTELLLSRTVERTRNALVTDFGIGSPRLALCGFNPHAGDGGRFGDEDTRIIAPVAARYGCAGPLSADTVFLRAMRGEFDVVIAPYHDVGMTAIKVASFGAAVNVTLGLPFVRTSPDHGTAMDIAGRGVADPSSMVRALVEAVRIVEARRLAQQSRKKSTA
jgi:4-hydroxythreonine-4-phosphate dehydrogenase